MTESIDVIYIAGIGRSGSTLLSRILGESGGAVNLGEFASYWTNPALRTGDLPCGCGRAVEACPRWSAWANDATITVDPALQASRSVFNSSRSVQQARDELSRQLGSLYRRASESFESPVLIDASKRAALALAAAAAPGVNLHLIHMTRAPRSVASSRSRAKSYLRPIPAWRVGLSWSGVNMAIDRVEKHIGGEVHMRHEDFVADPQAEMEKLRSRLALDIRPPEIVERSLEVSVQHSLAGNPDKLSGKTLQIVTPEDARLGMLDRFAVAALTLPFRRRFGY